VTAADGSPRRGVGGSRRTLLATVAWWAVVVTLGVTAVAYLPDQARRVRSDVQVGRRTGADYRELQPARTVGLSDLRPFLAAERVLPRDATFAVVTGPQAAIKDPLVLRWVRRFARYRLLPRRLIDDPHEADWVLSYGGRLPPGVEASRLIRVAPGIALYRVSP
jgi:hypothetical protein